MSQRDEGRRDRTRLRRAAAGRRVRRGRARGRRRRRRRPKLAALRDGPLVHRGRLRRARSPASPARPPDQRLRRPAGLRRDPDLRADAADAEPRARPRPADRQPATALAGVLQRGPARRARVDHLPGHHARAPRCRSSRSRASTAGSDFHLAFSPERIDPGRTDYTMRTTPKVVGGLTPRPAPRAPRPLRADLRRGRRGLHPRGRRDDEAAREHLPLGQHRARQRAGRCSATGWASTSGRSSTPPRPSRSASCASSPGPGMGGHCLPVDPFYLAWKAREYDFSTEFIELAGKVNQSMPHFCVERSSGALERRAASVKGSPRSPCSASPTRPASATSASRRR